jgi:hypothetical protein
VLLAVDTLGHRLAPAVTPADAREREQVAERAAAVQEATGQTVTPAHAGRRPMRGHGIRLEVFRHMEAKKGLVLPPAPGGRALVRVVRVVRAIPAAGP